MATVSYPAPTVNATNPSAVPCTCPPGIESPGELCLPCLYEYLEFRRQCLETEVADLKARIDALFGEEAPAPAGSAGMFLPEWVIEQIIHYRQNWSGDPHIQECIVDALEVLNMQIAQGCFLTVAEVYQGDRSIGSQWLPRVPYSQFGNMILDEIHRYRDLHSDAGDLVADVFNDMRQEMDHVGLGNYLRRLREIQRQRQVELFRRQRERENGRM